MASFAKPEPKRRKTETVKKKVGIMNMDAQSLFSKDHPYAALIEAIKVSVQPCTALQGQQGQQNKFTRRKCAITSKYVLQPTSKNQKNAVRSLIHVPILAGQYGEQHLSHMTLNTNKFSVLTKVPKVFNPELIKEAFIQMAIINRYAPLLEAEPTFARVVPTYGLFMCDQQTRNKNGKQLPRPINQCLSIDEILNNSKNMSKMNGQIYPFMIQEYLPPPIETFRKFIERDTTTLDDVREILLKVFKTLMHMQEGPYQITHGDLHSENILIHPTEKTVYIIDWGLASFTYMGLRYPNFIEVQYRINNNSDKDPQLLSGIYDFYFILRHLVTYANAALKEKMILIAIKMISGVMPHMVTVTYTLEGKLHSLFTDFYLYQFLLYAEDALSKKLKKNNSVSEEEFKEIQFATRIKVHKKNVAIINDIRYINIYEQISRFFTEEYVKRLMLSMEKFADKPADKSVNKPADTSVNKPAKMNGGNKTRRRTRR